MDVAENVWVLDLCSVCGGRRESWRFRSERVFGLQTSVRLDGSPGLWVLVREALPPVGQWFRRHLTMLAWISAMQLNGSKQIKNEQKGVGENQCSEN